MYVSTVDGALAPERLGPTLIREHLASNFVTPTDTAEGWRAVGRTLPQAGAQQQFYERPVSIDMLGSLMTGSPNRDNWTLDDASLAVAELAVFRGLGGATIVDQSAQGLGRNPRALKKIAEQTGVNVIMGTGWHHPAWSPEIEERSVDDLADEIVRDITVGTDGIRAGIIGRIAALNLEVAAERRLATAVAVAAMRTGAAVSVDGAQTLVETLAVLELFESEGVDLSRVAIGDCGRLARDLAQLTALTSRGVFVQFDALGDIPTVYTEVSDHDSALAILSLQAQGHGDRVLVSTGVHRKIDLEAFGGKGYGFIARQFVPYLARLGADDALLAAITVGNPQRLLAMPGDAA